MNGPPHTDTQTDLGHPFERSPIPAGAASI